MSWHTGTSSNSLGLSQGSYSCCAGFVVGKKFLPENPFEINKTKFSDWSPLGYKAVLVNGSDILRCCSAPSQSQAVEEEGFLGLLDPEVVGTMILL
jgi:hypothetical protein